MERCGDVIFGCPKTITVWHLHVYETALIEGVVFTNYTTEVQHISRNGINLVGVQRLLVAIRHGTIDVIKKCCCIGPRATDGFEGAIAG